MCRLISVLCMLVLAAVPAAGQFTSPTVFAIRVATGNNSVTLRNYNPATQTFGNDLFVPNTDTNALTIGNTISSEGQLTVSPNGQFLGFVGYRTGMSGDGTDRVVARYEVTTGTLNTATAMPNAQAYTTSSIRTAVWNDSGTQFWSGGNGSSTTGGTRTGAFQSTSGSIQVSATVVNTRVVGIFNGQLYTSTGSGATNGLNTVGTGLPTTSGNSTVRIADSTMTGSGSSSPYGFAISPNGLSLYMADDRSIANGGGIQKWSRTDTSSAFTLATTFGTGTGSTTGARGLAVDFSSADPTVYAVTAESSANRIVSFIDNGGVASSFTVLDIAGTGTIYRGIAFSSVPEPGTVLGFSLGVFGLVRVIRRRGRAGSRSAAGPRP
ncbi:MAG TPA: PEP-CTERM sorting domain-containing protein [Fimbriiglobus sp.]|jgi:hypothetical protein